MYDGRPITEGRRLKDLGFSSSHDAVIKQAGLPIKSHAAMNVVKGQTETHFYYIDPLTLKHVKFAEVHNTTQEARNRMSLSPYTHLAWLLYDRGAIPEDM